MGQAAFKSTDAAVGRGIDTGRQATESLVRTQVNAYRDPLWTRGMAVTFLFVALMFLSLLVFGITVYLCEEKKKKSKKKTDKKCKNHAHGSGWALVFFALALITYLVVRALHMVRNPMATAQIYGGRAIRQVI